MLNLDIGFYIGVLEWLAQAKRLFACQALSCKQASGFTDK